ncbi:hypothetical protein FRX31_018760 [Thalictrum thalictroides]|uniref:Uncharacterized protein n=1 Tax=Thalictrum thalictroides TaxID=46969 RepID=A0A7J6W3J4_THATH|nr:hypothetical protein FRX31_018760 [Thalictrum thalictroides]
MKSLVVQISRMVVWRKEHIYKKWTFYKGSGSDLHTRAIRPDSIVRLSNISLKTKGENVELHMKGGTFAAHLTSKYEYYSYYKLSHVFGGQNVVPAEKSG